MKTLNLDSSVINKKTKKSGDTESKTPTAESDVTANTKDRKITPPKNSAKKPLKQRLAEKWSAFKAWFKNLTPVQKVIFTGITCILIISIGGLISYFIVLREGTQLEISFPDSIPAKPPESRVYAADIPISEPNPPRDTPNPINGELYTKAEYEDMTKRYPIAVMIENHIEARPQSGYNLADIVYETLAEGGITRTMAIFWGRSATEIGPVRSARQYFIEWLMPYDPLYMHIGYAVSDDPRTNAGGSIYEYGIKSLDKYGTFWRVTDKFAPHNAYTSTELLYEKAEDYGYTGTPSDIDSLKFKSDAPIDQRGSSTTANLVFFGRLNNGGLYDVKWKYDKESNVYLRFNNNTPYTDALTNTQVFAKNVIIQRVETISAFDEKARMIITTIDEGDAIILRDGAVIYGRWKKSALEERTRYYDTDGEEIELNRGITWIEAVPIDQGTVQIDS